MAGSNGVARDFDQVHPENRSFKLAGTVFHWTPMWWRDFGEMVEENVAKLEAQVEEEAENGQPQKGRRKKAEPEKKPPTMVDSYQDLIDSIALYIEPSEVEGFRAIVGDKEKRVSHLQLTELRDWLREVTNNRPTEQPSPSGDGPGNTEATSPVASR